jgi:hypothetical protein
MGSHWTVTATAVAPGECHGQTGLFRVRGVNRARHLCFTVERLMTQAEIDRFDPAAHWAAWRTTTQLAKTRAVLEAVA